MEFIFLFQKRAKRCNSLVSPTHGLTSGQLIPRTATPRSGSNSRWGSFTAPITDSWCLGLVVWFSLLPKPLVQSTSSLRWGPWGLCITNCPHRLLGPQTVKGEASDVPICSNRGPQQPARRACVALTLSHPLLLSYNIFLFCLFI